MLTLIFGTANPQEVALAFLHGDQHDEEIGKKSAEKELRHLLQVSFDIELPASATLVQLARAAGAHVLLTDLVAALGEHVPAALASAHSRHLAGRRRCRACVWPGPGGTAATCRTATWSPPPRSSSDWSLSGPGPLFDAGSRPARTADSHGQDYPRPSLRWSERCFVTSRASSCDAASADLLQLADRPAVRFWAEVVPAVQARWALIASAAEVLMEADRVAKALKNAPATVPALVKAYAEDDEPWCLLDTHHRHMESRWYNFEFDAGDDQQGLDKLITKAEQRYTEVGSQLARHFVTQFSKAKHPIAGLLRQRDIFETQVKPRLRESKVAYVWVDALRFEMARELAQLLEDDFELTVQAGAGNDPHDHRDRHGGAPAESRVFGQGRRGGGGKLGLQIDRTVIKDRKDRIAFLKANAGRPRLRRQARRPAAQAVQRRSRTASRAPNWF